MSEKNKKFDYYVLWSYIILDIVSTAVYLIRDAMQQNLYLQREITAAREVYNDNVVIWNREMF